MKRQPEGERLTRIMPLGDSITFGAYGAGLEGVGGYRTVLWRKLADVGARVDFVGSITEHAAELGLGSGHDGHKSWRLDELATHVADWLGAHRPQLILLQAGTNDLIQGATEAQALERLETLVDRILKAAPEARLFVASLLGVREPNDYGLALSKVAAFNAGISDLVRARAARAAVSYHDLCGLANFSAAAFAADGLHPNDVGYQSLADTWYAVVGQYLTPALPPYTWSL